MVNAVLLAVASAQSGFWGHDGGHRQVLSMLLSTFAFQLQVSSCPRGLHSLPLPYHTEISYAPTQRTLVIQCLARFHLVFRRLSARRTLSSETNSGMVPCSKLTWGEFQDPGPALFAKIAGTAMQQVFQLLESLL